MNYFGTQGLAVKFVKRSRIFDRTGGRISKIIVYSARDISLIEDIVYSTSKKGTPPENNN